jgi:carbon storage regulator
MLSLSRKRGEIIVIGDNIRIMVTEIKGGSVRLGIEAPKDIRIYREEIKDNGPGKQGIQPKND